jgi:hypothetical protein
MNHLETLFSLFCYLALLDTFVCLPFIPTYQRMKVQPITTFKDQVMILDTSNSEFSGYFLFQHINITRQHKIMKEKYFLLPYNLKIKASPILLLFLFSNLSIFLLIATVLKTLKVNFPSLFNSPNNLQLILIIRPNFSCTKDIL